MQITVTGVRGEGKTTIAETIATFLRTQGAYVTLVHRMHELKLPEFKDGPLSKSKIMIVDVDETEPMPSVYL